MILERVPPRTRVSERRRRCRRCRCCRRCRRCRLSRRYRRSRRWLLRRAAPPRRAMRLVARPARHGSGLVQRGRGRGGVWRQPRPPPLPCRTELLPLGAAAAPPPLAGSGRRQRCRPSPRLAAHGRTRRSPPAPARQSTRLPECSPAPPSARPAARPPSRRPARKPASLPARPAAQPAGRPHQPCEARRRGRAHARSTRQVGGAGGGVGGRLAAAASRGMAVDGQAKDKATTDLFRRPIVNWRNRLLTSETPRDPSVGPIGMSAVTSPGRQPPPAAQ